MRLRAFLIGALALISGLTVFEAPAAGALTLPATRVTIVRPVTVAGHVARGYTVVGEPADHAICSAGTPASPAAVNPNILSCSPSALYVIACWRAAWAYHVLCLRDARRHVVARLPVDGPIYGHTTPYATPWPLDMVLGNGAYCTQRAGGAAAPLRGHPHYVINYYCDNGAAVWMRRGDSTGGVHRGRTWTVLTAPASGEKGVLTTRRVAQAWLVGTRYHY